MECGIKCGGKGTFGYPARITSMQITTLAVAATTLFALLAGDARAQGTKDYTGPLPHTNVGPLSPTTTRPTPNRQSNIYSPGSYVPRLRRIHRGYAGQRLR